jgi:hypothetical protein
LDYQPALLAAAARALTSATPSDPAFVSVAPGTKVTPKGMPTDAAYPGGSSSGLSHGAIAAAVVVPIVVVIIAILLGYWWFKRRSGRGASRRRGGGGTGFSSIFSRFGGRRYAAAPVSASDVNLK